MGCAVHPQGHLWIQRPLAHLHPVHSPSRQRTGLEVWPPVSQHPGYNQPFASHVFLISCIQYPQGSNLIHILFQFSKEGADFVFQTGPTQRTLQMQQCGMVKLLKAQPGCATCLCFDLLPAFPFGGSFKAALRLLGKTTALTPSPYNLPKSQE